MRGSCLDPACGHKASLTHLDNTNNTPPAHQPLSQRYNPATAAGPPGVRHSHTHSLLPRRWETSASPSSTHRNKDGVSINSAFDSGNIEVRLRQLLSAVCNTSKGRCYVWHAHNEE